MYTYNAKKSINRTVSIEIQFQKRSGAVVRRSCPTSSRLGDNCTQPRPDDLLLPDVFDNKRYSYRKNFRIIQTSANKWARGKTIKICILNLIAS